MLFFYHDRTDMQAEVSSPIVVYQVEGLEELGTMKRKNPMTKHEMKRTVCVADFC
jgi:hypothetical protein